ncbi:MAG: hypothetical protein ACRENE_11320 [Polyangiaceae bacterium]
MLVWPNSSRLTPGVRANLERLRESGAFKELQADTVTWTFDGLPWSTERPFRMSFRNAKGEPLEVVFEETGLWRFERPEEVPRFR